MNQRQRSEKRIHNMNPPMNNRQRLASSLLKWHGGQGSSLYALGSTWYVNKPVPAKVIEQAKQELMGVIERSSEWNAHWKPTQADKREIRELCEKIDRMTHENGSCI